MFHSFTAQSPFKHSNTNLHGSIEQMHKAHHIIPCEYLLKNIFKENFI